jgi:hypothetical protein
MEQCSSCLDHLGYRLPAVREKILEAQVTCSVCPDTEDTRGGDLKGDVLKRVGDPTCLRQYYLVLRDALHVRSLCVSQRNRLQYFVCAGHVSMVCDSMLDRGIIVPKTLLLLIECGMNGRDVCECGQAQVVSLRNMVCSLIGIVCPDPMSPIELMWLLKERDERDRFMVLWSAKAT